MTKKVVIVPPNGESIVQDFAMHRLSNFFKSKGIETYLLQLNNKKNKDIKIYTDYVIDVESQDDIVSYLQNNKFDLILHRSWMHRYRFAAVLAESFSNIVLYIKDWHDFPKEKYKFLYKTEEDFDGIQRIFKSGKTVLSHFTKEQHLIWEKRYQISQKQFLFFPEYCTKENFYYRKNIAYDKENVKLVMAGTLTSTSEPELVDAKSFYKKMKEITNCSVEVNIVLLKKFYDMVFTEDKYKDYLYEHTFNDYFSIHLGREMDPSILKEYDFGIFSDTFYNYELKKYSEHYKYAVISRVVLYLEAGLPIVVNRAMSSLSKIVEDNNIGIVFEDEDVERFNEILDINQEEYSSLVENVYKFREDFSYNDITMKPIMEMLR